MSSSVLKVLTFGCFLLQWNTSIARVFAFEEKPISACKTSEYYGQYNMELICSDDESPFDIFANTSTTGTVVCLHNNETRTTSMNSISFTNCKFSRAPLHLFNYFPLRSITLQAASLERLDKYDFVDTPYLESLNVGNNSLTAIPAKLFKFTPAIGTVFLSYNRITEIDPQAFNTTHNIKFLSLSHNRLTRVSKALLDTLPKLESLYLSYNSITEIEPNAFSGLSRLDALDLDGNQLEVVTSQMFSGLLWALRLDLSSNKIKRIEKEAFSDMRGLMTLQLNWNAIESIAPDAFAGLRKVYRLEINHNKLTILRNGIFDGMPDLQYLELHDNQINVIEPLAFNHEDLHDLDLSSNPISVLGSNIFSHAPHMRNVNLSHTNIAEIREGFMSSAPKLEELDVSFCKLRSIDFSYFSRFANTLYSLYVDGNELTQLPDEIREMLPNLRHLGITNNNFTCSYLRDVYPTIGAKTLARAIEKRPIAPNETNYRGIRCT